MDKNQAKIRSSAYGAGLRSPSTSQWKQWPIAMFLHCLGLIILVSKIFMKPCTRKSSQMKHRRLRKYDIVTMKDKWQNLKVR